MPGLVAVRLSREDLGKSRFYTACTAYLPYKPRYECATGGAVTLAMWLCGSRGWCPRANPHKPGTAKYSGNS
jgi:hypothetical protein